MSPPGARDQADPEHWDVEELLRAVLDHMDDLVAVVDLEGRRLYNSPSYAKLFGDPRRLSGSDSFAEIHPEDRDHVRELFRQVVATGQGRRAQFRFLLPGARIRYIESQSDVIRDAQGRPARVIIVSRDITQRKQAEAQLLQNERLALLGQMAAGLAHELKNPLMIILNAVSVLTGDMTGFDRAQIVGYIGEAAQRASDIITRTLSFARPAPLTLTPQPLAPIVRAALDMVAQQVGRRMAGIEVAAELPEDLPLALVDKTALLQALINLGVNAVQAMPDGGTLCVRAGVITLAAPGNGVGQRASDVFRVGDQAVWCEVSDTGVGIAPEQLEKIFEPFFTTKAAGEGTGLGLPTVRTILQGHRGLVSVESVVGRGTTFRLLLHAAP
jgi:PAS domain S-box-containing protein